MLPYLFVSVSDGSNCRVPTCGKEYQSTNEDIQRVCDTRKRKRKRHHSHGGNYSSAFEEQRHELVEVKLMLASCDRRKVSEKSNDHDNRAGN